MTGLPRIDFRWRKLMAEQLSDPTADERAIIARLLLRCEDAGGASHEYVRSNPDNPKPPVPIDSHGDEIFVISDLHLADGLGPDGRYGGNENFFCDSSFRRFLRQAHSNPGPTNAILIINGDFVDFLRVMYVPREDSLLVD